MGSEVELKLEVSAEAAARVAALPWLRDMITGPATRTRLVTVYFDTSKHRLRDAGVSLRIRRSGKQRLQTIKTLGNGAKGPFGRDEWEQEVDRDRPDLKLAAGTALEKFATKKLRRKLRSVFETAVERTTIPLHWDSSDIELAIDHGQIRTSGRREAINEIELELKSGDPEALATLAERLAGSVPAAYGARAKSERGYALSAGEAGQPVGAEPIALSERASTGDALTAIGLSCLKQLISNREAVRRGEAEGVHQMRVGLRRLRAALSLFKELIPGTATEAIKTELKWLTNQLGPAREFEVLIEERVRPLRAAGSGATGVRILDQDLQVRRRQALGRACAALDSERYRRLGLRVALWLAHGRWAQDDDPLAIARRERPAQEFAAEVLGKRMKKITKKIRKLDALSARDRHRLRIAIKKLRYAAEFFGDFFGGRKRGTRRRRVNKILKDLQASLGTLNDIEVHKHLAETVISSERRRGGGVRKKAEEAFALGFISGQEQKQVASCLALAAKAGKQLSDAKPFWR